LKGNVTFKAFIIPQHAQSLDASPSSVCAFGVCATLLRRGKRNLNSVHGATIKIWLKPIFALSARVRGVPSEAAAS
jgi:hypothetical protein